MVAESDLWQGLTHAGVRPCTIEPMPTTAELARLLRYWSLTATTAAGSGHPTSCLSAADLIASLFFDGHFRFRLDERNYPNNDRLIFSKGHAAPLLYALWAAAGAFPAEKLTTLRQLNSPLQGHPLPDFPWTEVATGSLGQGLSVGLGMALQVQRQHLDYRTFVLLGDGEMAEGSIWEAIQLAAHYRLGNLIGIIDVNRLAQTGPTQFGHQVVAYQQRVTAFGWQALVIDGHDLAAISQAYATARQSTDQPVMIIAHTLKGKEIAVLEDRENRHAKVVPPERLATALAELGPVDQSWRGQLAQPITAALIAPPQRATLPPVIPPASQLAAVREGYGDGLVRLANTYPELLVLDADLSNSTFSDRFQQKYPHRFYEMFIAEQNMVGVGAGLAARGQIPFLSTLAAFWPRAFDQLRMAAYSLANLKLCGSHAGVAIGADGVSQMGLEDIALFRSLFGCTVLYPSDYPSMLKLVELAAAYPGMVYLRSTRQAVPVLYTPDTEFKVGGSHTLRHSDHDQATIVAAGITLHEALKAADRLAQQGIAVRVIDLYSIQPIDTATLVQAVRNTKHLIVVEDHYAAGGMGEAVRSALGNEPVKLTHLAVRGLPHSGTSAENLAAAGIDAASIASAMKI